MSELRRLHLPDARAGEMTIDGSRVHYLTHVLRLEVGASLEVFDQGRAFTARITAASANTLTLLLEDERIAKRSREVIVVQGLPKADKLELILQKATELGASAIAPVSTTRSIVKLDGKEAKKLERWQRIVEEAARQSRRADVPQVLEVTSLALRLAALRKQRADLAVLVLDEEEQLTRLSHAIAAVRHEQPVAVVIGPEGGFAREEVDAMRALGAVTVSLGSLILRTETAALVGLAVIRHHDGELG